MWWLCKHHYQKVERNNLALEDVDVNVEEKQVVVTTQSTIDADFQHTLSEKLLKLGYPEVGTDEANNLKAKAASIVSCAVGKVSSKS